MKKYSIIANCQGGVLNTFLRTNKYFVNNYKYIELDAIQILSKEKIDNFYNDIKLLDLIIIQPINDNYRNYQKYSTKSILANIKKECKVIMFPSIYFTGYYPNIINVPNKAINIYVHDKNIIKKFLNSKNKQSFIDDCVNMIKDSNFYSKDYVMNNINNSISNLLKKELDAISTYKPQYFIKLSKFIEDNYMKNILSVSLNHHTKYIYWYLSTEIFNIININITPYPEEIDPQVRYESCIIYESVINVINKNFEKNKFSQRELPQVDLITYLSFHYDKYSLVKEDLIENIHKYS